MTPHTQPSPSAPIPTAPLLARAPAGTPLYVHLPFCAAKCHYCDFFSVPDAGQDVDGMVAAILAEAEQRAPREPRTVFLGGGTPSLLSASQLSALLDGLERATGFRSSAIEVTAECNPESLDEAKASHLLELGVKRLSIGFQALDDTVLELFGRVHSTEDSFRAFRAARRAGVQALNVDLIYAYPGQTAEGWRKDLESIIALEPNHVSAYNLTYEEDTRFQRWLEQGRLSKAPDDLELEFFYTARRMLAEAGFEAYEISNYARSGSACEHNIGYWRNGPYVGLGPSAVSKVENVRAGNTKTLKAYLEKIRSGEAATAWSEEPDAHARLAETWWLGLRLAAGVEPETARQTAGFVADSVDSVDPARTIAESLVASGHLHFEGGRFRLTPLGLPVADAVAAEFLRRTKVTDDFLATRRASGTRNH